MSVLTCTHLSPHPSRGESCAHSTLPGPPARQHPCMDCSDTFVGVNWCRHPTAPLHPCHNQKPAGITQGLFRGGQACRAWPRWVACLLLPGTDPAAWHQQRSGGEHARGHSIWRHRQDQSDYLRPGHPCGAGDQKMGGRGTQGCPSITLLQCGCRQGCGPPRALALAGLPPCPAHLLHGRITLGSNTAGPARGAGGVVPPAGAGSPVPVLVPGRCWLGTRVLAAGGQAGGGSPTEPSPPDGEGH